MPLFDKKKKSGHIKPLSEEEIQKKLYGTFQDANANLLPNDPHEKESESDRFKGPKNNTTVEQTATAYKTKYESAEAYSSFSSPQKQSPEKETDDFSAKSDSAKTSFKYAGVTDEDPLGAADEKDLFSLSDQQEDLLSDQFESDLDVDYDTDEYIDDETPLYAHDDPPMSVDDERSQDDDLEQLRDEPLFRIENPDPSTPKKTASSGAYAAMKELKKQDVSADTSSLDEVIQKEESVSFSYESKPAEALKESVNTVRKSDVQPVADTTSFTSSFKIDLAEFLDKLKRISPFLIGGILFFIVFTLVIFNMWIRTSSKTGEESIEHTAQEAVATRTDRTSAPLQATQAAGERAPSRVPAAATVPSSVPSAVVREDADVTVTPVVPPVNDFYSIQVCIYNDSQRAEDLVSQLKEKGFDAFYSRLTTRTNRVLYTVFVGRFDTSKAANEYYAQFKDTDVFQQFPDSFIKLNK